MFIRIMTTFLFMKSAVAAIPQPASSNLDPIAKFTYKDKVAAVNYIGFVKSLKDEQLKLKTLTGYRQSFSNSIIFKPLTGHVDLVKSIIQNKDTEKIIESCKNGKHNHDPLIRRIEHHTEKFCVNHILGKASKNNALLSNEIFKKFLRERIIKFLEVDQVELGGILSKIEYGSEFHKNITNVILEEARTLPSVRINEEVVKNLYIDHEITRKIQDLKLLDRGNKGYFKTEFKKLVHNVYDQIEGGSEFLNRSMKQLLGFHKSNSEYLDDEKSWARIINTGKKLSYFDNQDLAKDVFTYSKIISDADEKEEALFQIIWLDIQRSDFRKARESIHNYSLQVDKVQSQKLKFWIAKVFEETGNTDGARKIYQDLSTGIHLSYYAILSLKKLVKDNVTTNTSFIRDLSEPLRLPASKTEYTDFSRTMLKRVNLWVELGNHLYSKSDIKYLLNRPINEIIMDGNKNKDFSLYKIHADMSEFLKNKGNHLLNFQILYPVLSQKVFPLNKELFSHLFPMEYLNEIEKHSDYIDPLIVLSLIRQESAFNPSARSHVGARGLMQIMPGTAKQMDRRVTKKALRDPKVNIKLGVRYLKKLLKQYDGNLIFALAAYNAGPNRVAKWSKTIFKSDNPLEIIESIPFQETRNYVKLIYRNLFYYELLNNKLELKKDIKDTFFLNNKESV